MCSAHVCTSLSQKSETHWVKPCANTVKNRWWNHSILEISVWSVFDLTQIRLLRITLIPDQNGRSHCKINQDAEKAKRMMITAPWAMEWIMLYFQFICSSWLTDLFGVLKSNLTKVTKWDPHDFYFATRSLFLFKFFPGQEVVWAAVWPKLHTQSLTRSLGTVCLPSVSWKPAIRECTEQMIYHFLVGAGWTNDFGGQKLYLIFMRIQCFAASNYPLVFCWNNTTGSNIYERIGEYTFILTGWLSTPCFHS